MLKLKGDNVMMALLTRSGPGRMGLLLLAVMVALSIYVILTYPLDFGSRVWSDPAFWADNPKAVPPAWTNFFSPLKRAEHRILEAKGVRGILSTYIEYDADEPPTFLSLGIRGLVYHSYPPLLTLMMKRPDGSTLVLYRAVAPPPLPAEEGPFHRFFETPLRINLGSSEALLQSILGLYEELYGLKPESREVREDPLLYLFGRPSTSGGGIEVLKGRYEFILRLTSPDARDRLQEMRLVLGGSVFGFMGTDSLGRDLAVGLLLGFPVALAIGASTALLVTAVATFLGILSGYKGGQLDNGIQRISDIFANMPLLPLLIFLSFVLGQKLFIVIIILVAFGWPGLTIILRSMVLQIKESQFVEAARALGASPLRIMFRHIFPQAAPFILSQMVFLTPGAILAEAALSFLGLGDPSIPTWGQILEHGFRNGAVYVGLWWWVLPPGLLIVLSATTFVLLALALEPAVNPKLRRMA